MNKIIYILFFIFYSTFCFTQNKITISGKITNKNKETISNVRVYLSNDIRNYTYSDGNGNYSISIKSNSNTEMIFNNISYEQKRITLNKKFLKKAKNNRIEHNVVLNNIMLGTFIVKANSKPDTIFGSKTSSISDFEFYGNKLILLSYEKKLKKGGKLQLTGYNNKLISEYKTPPKPKRLFKDYGGNLYLITEYDVFLITVFQNEIRLQKSDKNKFYGFTKRIIDTLNDNFLYSDFSDNYPAFSYYAQFKLDTTPKKIHYSENKFMMELYRAEYKYVSGREKLWAFQQELRTGIDKEIWTGAKNFTQSLYYEPLYAPLFINQDTVLIFDHYSNYLYKFDNEFKKTDSIPINYHKGKSKKNWEQPILKDKEENKLYALYLKNGFYYMKYINLSNGEVKIAFKLNYRYIENVKVKNGFVYYIYRPFESTQKKYLYREVIHLK